MCDALFDKEAFFRDEYSHETPNILAGRIMVNLCADGDLEAKAEGNRHCATMAMGLLALKGLRPNLSGLIGEHVAFFTANPRAAFARNAFRCGLTAPRITARRSWPRSFMSWLARDVTTI